MVWSQLNRICTHSKGLNSTACARILGTNPKAIYNAKNSNTIDSFGDLHLNPTPREKLEEKSPLLDKWVKTLQTKSGTYQRLD